MTDRNTHLFLGYNYRMNEIFAAIGRKQLAKLDDLNDSRIINSQYLHKNINSIQKLYKDEDVFQPSINKCVYFWFPVVASSVPHAKLFMKKLKDNEIEFRYRYEKPLYQQPIFRGRYYNLQHRVAERLSGCVIGLPNHSLLQKVEIDKVIEIANRGNE